MSGAGEWASSGAARLARADRRLLRVVGESLDDAARRAGPHLACRPGCTDCCHGPFPITRLDAWRLARGLVALASAEPARAAAVRERARAQAALFNGELPDGALGSLTEEGQEAFFTRHGALPCPALEPTTGLCALYAHRPLTCRTFGPPVAYGAARLPPCRLCFTGASAAEVEACRVAPDPDDLEGAALAAFGAAAEEETLIALALK